MIAMMQDKQGRKLISCRTAAETYGCSMRYIRKLIEQGKLYHEMEAGSYMVAEADISKFKARVEKGTGRHKAKPKKFRPG